MAKLIDHFQDLMGMDVGSQYFKTDLHIHTPSSKDAQWKTRYHYNREAALEDKKAGYPRAKQIANQILDKLVAENISVAAFTDHNSPGFIDNKDLTSQTWFELIQKIYDQRVEKDNTHPDLLLLPGVEITTDRIHILGVFNNQDPHITFKIASLLRQVDIREHEFGEVDGVFGTKSIWDVADAIHEIGGICIPAHINASTNTRSLLNQYKPPDMEIVRLVQHHAIHVFGVVHGKDFPDHRTYKSLIDNKRIPKRDLSYHGWMVQQRSEVRQHLPALGYMANSDAHSVERIGARYSWVSLDSLSFRSLAAALRNPAYRIGPNHLKPMEQVSNQVLGLSFEGGFAGGLKMRFSPHFNCIIGGSGTGKSSLMRIIRDTYNARRFGLRVRDETERLIDGLAPGLWDLMKGGEIFTQGGTIRVNHAKNLGPDFSGSFLETRKTPWTTYIFFSKTGKGQNTTCYAVERHHPTHPKKASGKEDRFKFFRSQAFQQGSFDPEQVQFEEIKRPIFHAEVARPGFYAGRDLGTPENDYRGARALLETHLLRSMDTYTESRNKLFGLLRDMDRAAAANPVDEGLIHGLVAEVKGHLEAIYQMKLDFANAFNRSEVQQALRIGFGKGDWADIDDPIPSQEAVKDFTHNIRLYLHGREHYDPVVLSFFRQKGKKPSWQEIPFEALSTSQRNLMTLRLLFSCPKEMAPLFIDEPEQWMDNEALDEFYDLRRMRNDQVITFTENPNIAVLGNSEQNFVLDVRQSKTQTVAAGGLEADSVAYEIIRLLEGGTTAFQRKLLRYYSELLQDGLRIELQRM